MRVLLVLEGLVTLILCAVALPIGVALVIANAVLAFVFRGVNRWIFASTAIAGAMICLAIGLLLLGTTGSGEVQVVQLG